MQGIYYSCTSTVQNWVSAANAQPRSTWTCNPVTTRLVGVVGGAAAAVADGVQHVGCIGIGTANNAVVLTGKLLGKKWGKVNGPSVFTHVGKTARCALLLVSAPLASAVQPSSGVSIARYLGLIQVKPLGRFQQLKNGVWSAVTGPTAKKVAVAVFAAAVIGGGYYYRNEIGGAAHKGYDMSANVASQIGTTIKPVTDFIGEKTSSAYNALPNIMPQVIKDYASSAYNALPNMPQVIKDYLPGTTPPVGKPTQAEQQGWVNGVPPKDSQWYPLYEQVMRLKGLIK